MGLRQDRCGSDLFRQTVPDKSKVVNIFFEIKENQKQGSYRFSVAKFPDFSPTFPVME